METAFIKAKALSMSTFLSILIASALVTVVFILFYPIDYISIITLAYMTIFILTCILLFKFSTQIQNYISIILTSISLGFFLTQVFSLNDLIVHDYDNTPFHIGYIFGIFEKILVQHISRIEHKVAFLIVSLVVRVLVFKNVSDTIMSYQFVWWLINILSEVWREKDERTQFRKLFKIHESLEKYKHLMVSGLPINIMILSKNFKQKLFTNESFQTTFQTKPDSSTDSFDLSGWLSRFRVEKEGLSGSSKDALGEEVESELTMMELTHKLVSKRLLDNPNYQFVFNIRSQETGDPCSRKIFMVRIFGLPWDGEDGIAMFLNDVTQQYQNLTLKVADVNKDKMLAMVSHELRTPLNGILGMIFLMEKQVTDEQILTYLKVCKNSGNLLLNLVNSILDLGQIRNKKFQLKVARGVNINDLLQEIYVLFEFQFRAKGLYLKMNVMSNLPSSIDTDPNRLKQIIINLIGNALKFTFNGGVEVFVNKDRNREGFIRFKVSDTGIGIKQEDQEKLFKMYGRLDQNDMKLNSEGVGLGLTISDHLVRLLSGGEEEDGIKVESEFNKGTTFSFSVSGVLSEDELNEYDIGELEGREHSESDDSRDAVTKPPIYVFESNSVTSPMLKNKMNLEILLSPATLGPGVLENGSVSPKIEFSRDSLLQPSFYNGHEDSLFLKKSESDAEILLVDDSPFNIMVAKTLINNLGYHVETALNGKIAIDIVSAYAMRKKSFKMIFMDCQMPIMSGYETTRALRLMMMDREVPDTPIVALSANDSQEDKQKCVEVGMCDHLSKPLNEERLRQVLNKFCK